MSENGKRWNRPTEEQSGLKKGKANGARQGGSRLALSCKSGALLVAACAVAIVALVVYLFLGGETKKVGSTVKERGRIKEVPSAKPKAREAKPQKERMHIKPKTVEEAFQNIGELNPEAVPKATNRVDILLYKKRIFDSGTEQLMSLIFTTEPGDIPFPLPPLSENDRKNLAAVLISDNPITKDDDEKSAFCKETVQAAKKEMSRYIREGGDPDDFLEYYHKELRKAFDYRMMAINEVNMLSEKDGELARGFLKKVNENLIEKGIKPLDEKALLDDPEIPSESWEGNAVTGTEEQ